jgi:hypothetical protein
MTGRWIIDCGHTNWQAELHPYEFFASSHIEVGRSGRAVGLEENITNVVLTGAWPGGTLEFDVWPPARPSALAHLKFVRQRQFGPSTQDIIDQPGIKVFEALEPRAPDGSPNHLHVRLESLQPWQPLPTKSLNDVYYDDVRRLYTRYRLWWENPQVIIDPAPDPVPGGCENCPVSPPVTQ